MMRVMSRSIREQVIEFHEAMEHPIALKPSVPPDARVRFRARLITEEYFESMRALFAFADFSREEESVTRAIDVAEVLVDLPELVDGLADLDYVVEGTRLEFGVAGPPIAEEVHRANMAKLGGGKTPAGKTIKPPGWKPPDIEGELRAQGWEGRPR
jgi:predicted HAD superfamily Cof-like phosphohydrolase